MVLPSCIQRDIPVFTTESRIMSHNNNPVVYRSNFIPSTNSRLTLHTLPASHTLLPSPPTPTTPACTNKMPATTSTSASTRAFANYDLLEDILLHLPLRDLLFSRRVCKQWNGVQDTSARVRKALFLEPFHQEKVYYPSASKPHWHLVPTPAECAQEGLFDNDSETTPREYKLQVSDPTAPTPDESDIPSSGSSNGSNGSDSSGGSDVTVCNLAQDKQATAKKTAKDGKMPVSRIASGPFLNPFAELFRTSTPIPSLSQQRNNAKLTPEPPNPQSSASSAAPAAPTKSAPTPGTQTRTTSLSTPARPCWSALAAAKTA